MGNEVLKVGIVGSGHIGNYHARMLQAVPGNQVTAVADLDEPLAKAMAEKVGNGCQAYSDPLKMIKKGDIDVLYLCVPPMAHGPYEKAAVKRKLPMLIEKPVAPNLALAKKINKMLPPELVVSVAYNWRYMPNADRVRQVCQEHKPSGFIATWKEGIPPARWWRTVETSGGPVIEQASHLLDLGMYYCGPIKRVQAMAVAHRPKDFGDISDLVMANFEFESGAIGQLMHTCLLNGRIHRIGYDIISWGVEVSGERDGSVSIRTANGTEELAGGYDSSYQKESAAFLHAVRTGDRSGIRCTYKEAMESIALGEAIAKSAKTGRPVNVAKVD